MSDHKHSHAPHQPDESRATETPRGNDSARREAYRRAGDAAVESLLHPERSRKRDFVFGDAMVFERGHTRDDDKRVFDVEAETARSKLLQVASRTENAIRDGVEDALTKKICAQAAALDGEKQGEVVKFVGKALLEQGLKYAGEGVEGATAPILALIEVRSLSEGIAKANLEVREGRTIRELVKTVQRQVPARFEAIRSAIRGLDGQTAIDLAEEARVELTADEVAEEFEALVETAMIQNGYAARDAIEHVEARLRGAKPPAGD